MEDYKLRDLLVSHTLEGRVTGWDDRVVVDCAERGQAQGTEEGEDVQGGEGGGSGV
jgi:hypothetical protein